MTRETAELITLLLIFGTGVGFIPLLFVYVIEAIFVRMLKLALSPKDRNVLAIVSIILGYVAPIIMCVYVMSLQIAK